MEIFLAKETGIFSIIADFHNNFPAMPCKLVLNFVYLYTKAWNRVSLYHCSLPYFCCFNSSFIESMAKQPSNHLKCQVILNPNPNPNNHLESVRLYLNEFFCYILRNEVTKYIKPSITLDTATSWNKGVHYTKHDKGKISLHTYHSILFNLILFIAFFIFK